MQRSPSPKKTGAASSVVPWSRMLNAFGSSPELVITSVWGEVVPEAASCAPDAFCEFAQPWPAAPVLLHGQATEPVPSPKQKGKPTPVSHSSGMPLKFVSRLVPPARAHESGTPFRLQSGAPAAIAHASPIESPSQSCCSGFAIVGQLSQASPTSSPSVSVCVAFATVGQLSTQLATPSPSVSVSATPQPHWPGAILSGSFGQPSWQLAVPSPSGSASGTPQPPFPGAVL